jgi:hypothetical protein
MRKRSTSNANPDLIQPRQRLVNTAEILVNRAPRQKRIEVERSALFDTLSHAQLVLSVTRLPQGIDKEVPKRGKQQEETRGLEDQLKQS